MSLLAYVLAVLIFGVFCKLLFRRRPTPIVVILEGLVGSGKSLLLKILQEDLKEHFESVVTVQEPVDQWVASNILQEFYANPRAKSFEFQVTTYSTRIQALRDAWQKEPLADVYILERSPFSDRYIFVEMLERSGLFTKGQMGRYITFWREFIRLWPVYPTHFIHVCTPVPLCQERLQKRNRDGEAAVSEEYQTNLQLAHERFFLELQNPRDFTDLKPFSRLPVLKLDNTQNLSNLAYRRHVVKQVVDFLRQPPPLPKTRGVV